MSAHDAETRRLTLLSLAATGVGFLPWFAISALGPFLVDDLGVSAAVPGRLVGLLFVVGVAGNLLMGGLIRRWGPARLLVLTFAVTGGALTAMALAPTVATLAVAVGVAGLVIAVPMPATAALVASRVASERRGAIIGVAQSGQQLGALTVGLVLPVIAAAHGWRWSLGGAALGALAIGVAFRAGARGDRTSPAAPAASVRSPRWLMAYALLMSSWTVAAVAFLPVFGTEAHGMSGTVAGRLITVIGIVAIGGKILWGRFAGRAMRPTTPLIVLSSVAALGISMAALAPSLGDWAVWASAATVGASALAWPVVTLSLVARRVVPEHAGGVSGRILAAGFSGSAIGPILFGWLLETRGYVTAWWFGVGVTLVAASIVAIAVRWERPGGRAAVRAAPVAGEV